MKILYQFRNLQFIQKGGMYLICIDRKVSERYPSFAVAHRRVNEILRSMN